jgi:hypothetical protein
MDRGATDALVSTSVWKQVEMIPAPWVEDVRRRVDPALPAYPR